MRSTIRQTLLLATLSLLASACQEPTITGTPSDFEEVRVHRQEIKGGRVDSDHPAVVGIVIQQGFAGGLCTGTLVAPNLVLTAQHCVAELPGEFVDCGNTTFGDVYSASSFFVTTKNTFSDNPRDYYAAYGVYVPEPNSDVCGNDIAMIILRQNIPSDVAVPIIPRIDELVREGEEYTAIGYGQTGNNGGEGTRRILEGREVECDGPRCPEWTSVQTKEFLGSDGTCQGDSGGPPLDTQGRVLGALSRGPAGCSGSVYSSVARWGQWMREIGSMAAERGEYPEPLWVAEGSSMVLDDEDRDGVPDDQDNCPEDQNNTQADLDNDGRGDICDGDRDGDGVDNDDDNCPIEANEDQADKDDDGFGDECDARDNSDTNNADNNTNNDDNNTNNTNNSSNNNSSNNNSANNNSSANNNGADNNGGDGFVDECESDGFVSECDGGGSGSTSSTSCQSAPTGGPGASGLGGLLLLGAAFVGLRRRR
jgi:MYXO-CTERM domain-containing protein